MVQYELDESYGGNYGGTLELDHIHESYMPNNWTHIAESTMPLKESKLASANRGDFQTSIEIRSKQISTRVIVVNLVSLIVNLLLAIVAFYFSYTTGSTSITAFGADCVLDLISSAILLWRYHGDLNSVYMHAREQIACIYLGALFGLSSLGIIIKAGSDMLMSAQELIDEVNVDGSFELVYLAIVASIACSILTVFKCALYKTLRDSSILVDVINTLISTVFAMSILMSQALINVNPSFWYLDPILSIILALLMMGFGIKVIHENFNILKPVYYNRSNGNFSDRSFMRSNENATLLQQSGTGKQSILGQFDRNNLSVSLESNKNLRQKADYSTITFS